MKWKENILGNVVVAFKEPHRSTSGPLTETGDSTEYSLTLTNMGLGGGGGGVDEAGCSLGEIKYSLSAPVLGPVGPCFGLKVTQGCGGLRPLP